MRDWKEANSVFTTIAAVAGRSLTDLGPRRRARALPRRRRSRGICFRCWGHRRFSAAASPPRTIGPAPVRSCCSATICGPGDTTARRAHHRRIDPGQRHAARRDRRDAARLCLSQQSAALDSARAHLSRRTRGTCAALFAFGRLKPGVTIDRARQDLDAIAGRLAAQYPSTNEGWTSRLRTLRDAFLPEEVPLVLYLMMAGVTLVLFIACSNVANLLLARAAGRRREISVRTALGAGRGRIVRQLLTESVVLGLISVPLGILLAVVGTRLIAAGIPPDQVPYYVQVGARLAVGCLHGGHRRVDGARVRTVSGLAGVARQPARDLEGRHARQQRRAVVPAQLAGGGAGGVRARVARRRAAVRAHVHEPRRVRSRLRHQSR